MFQKSGFIFILVIYMAIAFCSAQAPEPRAMKNPNKECEGSLSAKPEDCCKLPNIFEDSIITKCMADFGASEPPAPPTPDAPPTGCCVAECILNTTKILVDGKFDKNLATTIITASVTDTKWSDVISKAVETCEKEHSDLKDKFTGLPPSDPANHKCNPVPGIMIGCVRANMFQNCPNYSSDAKCATMKSEIDKCPMALMKPH